jgi:hypothetical protein
MSYVDAIVHVVSVPDLAGFLAGSVPEGSGPDGPPIACFSGVPVVRNGAAALAYVRVTPATIGGLATGPGVTVLAQAPYMGEATPDVVYAAMFADPGMVALYDAVYDRGPSGTDTTDGMGQGDTPPDRFGVLG